MSMVGTAMFFNDNFNRGHEGGSLIGSTLGIIKTIIYT